MLDFFSRLFDTGDFPARWHCGSWSEGHGWLHILSDLGIWSAYLTISCVIGYFVLFRNSVAFRTVFWLFGAFILGCGTTHLLEAALFWWPAYRLAGLIKLITALVSWGTVVALISVVPKALAMGSPRELEAEIARRQTAEANLLDIRAALEIKVREQTEALRTSEERFRIFVERVQGYGIYLLDPHGLVNSWNSGAQQIKGYRDTEVIGNHFRRFYIAEDVASGLPEHNLMEAIAKGAYEGEGWRIRKDGSRFWASVVITALRNQAGDLCGFSKVIRDLTERRRSEERLRSVVEAAPTGMLLVKADGRIILANAQIGHMFGYDAHILIDEQVELLIPQRIRADHIVNVQRYFADPHMRLMGIGRELYARRKDGSEFPVEIGINPIKMEEGQFVLASIIDVTERKRAEAALRESEAQFRQLADSIPQLAWTARPDGHIYWYNQRWYDYTGTTPEMMEGWGWQNVHDPEELPKVLERWQTSIATGEPFEMVFPLRGADGQFRSFLTRVFPQRSPEGQVLQWFGTNTNIDEQKRAEDQLRELNATLEERVVERTQAFQESERRFRAIFHAQFQFIGLMSPAGKLLEANRTALATAGVSEESVLGKMFWDTVWWTHDSAQQDRLRAAVRCAAGGERDRFEASHPAADGSIIWVDFSLTPFCDESGEVVLLIPEGRDITQRKKAEEALRLEEERFRNAFEHAPIGFALVAPDGKWQRVNHSMCEIVGYSASELLDLNFQAITHADDLGTDLDYLRDMLAGTIKTCQLEKRFIHKQGHVIHILLSAYLVRNAQGVPLHFIAQIKDITQRKVAESQLKGSLREKEVLLKEIHHRVKNNLQIVSTLLDLQSDHTQDRQALEMFKESRGRVKSMALIHERLYRSQDLARVNFNEYTRQLAEDLYHTYKVSDDEIVLHVEVAVPPLPIDIAIPCGLLLNELMSNCLKHGFANVTEGWIRVTLCNDGPNSVLTVADNGKGFPAGFDFRNTTSFGLQLVNTLVEQLQGEVELKTEGGSEFIVIFPMHHNSPNGTHQ